jgi:two-component system response regulator (stage 0 sporulation protein A)
MDDLITILIADDNVKFCSVLSDYLNQCGGMTVQDIANDGIEAIKKIKELNPEIVILDLIMPNLDGIGVLERISDMQLKKKPIFIVLSGIGKDIFIQKSMELGAEYYMMKPFDVNMLVSRIRQLHNEKIEEQGMMKQMPGIAADKQQEKEGSSLEQIITDLIKKMGISPNIAGYHYLRDAVMLSIGNTTMFNTVPKHIYKNIADKYNTTTRNVGRAIKGAVDSAFKKSQKSGQDSKSTVTAYSGKGKPVTAQVIAMLVSKARLEMKI